MKGIIERLRERRLVGQVLQELLGLDAPPEPGASVPCPRHDLHKRDDANPSFVIGRNGEGGVCMANCGLQGGLLDLVREVRGLPDRKAAAVWLEQHYLNGQRQVGDEEQPHRKPRVIRTTRYEVRDAEGQLVAIHVRRDKDDGTKGVHWERPGGTAGLDGVRVAELPLYGIERLATASAGEPVILVEGEKAADALRQMGLPLAIGTVTGASVTPSRETLVPLAGRRVHLWPDNDTAGREHMQRIADVLVELGAEPLTIEWDGAPAGGDAADLAESGGLRQDVVRLLASAKLHDAAAREQGQPEGETQKLSQATQLVRLVEQAGVELFHDDAGVGYATIPSGEHRETWPLRKKGFKGWLAKLFFNEYGKAPTGSAVQDALGVLDGRAVHDGDQHRVHVRVAECDGDLYLDLGCANWKVVHVSRNGWRVIDDAPVRFWRPDGLKPLPVPEKGGQLRDLRDFVNIESDDDWVLYQAALVAGLRPDRSFPVLVLNGEQGSCKSTTARVARQLIDPNKADLRSPPRNEYDLVIAAKNGWLIAFDNISKVRSWLSDALCRMATGGGFGTRRLYENDEEALFDAKRLHILTGIEDVVTQNDLLDRSIVITLPRLRSGQRRDEEAFWQKFHEAKPRLLGALLDAVATALRRLPEVVIDDLPRMADFARWSVAAEPALDCADGAFLGAYWRKRADANEAAIEGSALAVAVREHMRGRTVPWVGTATDLLDCLNNQVEDDVRSLRQWPKDASSLSNKLRRDAPALRACGIDVEREQEPGSRSRKLIRLTPLDADAGDAPTLSPDDRGDPAPGSPTQDRRADATPRRTTPPETGISVGGVGGVAPLQDESDAGDDWEEVA